MRISGWRDQLSTVLHGPAKGSDGPAPWRIVKCRCGQLELPLDAVGPICVRAATRWPHSSLMLLHSSCPYTDCWPPLTMRVVDGGEGRYAFEMQPVADDPERELAGAFASLLRRAPDRLNRCEECGRFFVDSTRSRRRHWCTPQCGDRARVRSHRARRGS